MSLMEQLLNEMTIQSVRVELLKNEQFAAFDDGFVTSDIFRDQVLFRANQLNMSVNAIVADYLTMNGI